MDDVAAAHYQVIATRWPGHDIHVVSIRDHAVSAVVDHQLFVRSGSEAERIGEVWVHFQAHDVPLPTLVEVSPPLVASEFVRNGGDPLRLGAMEGLGRTVAALHRSPVPATWVGAGLTADRWDRSFVALLEAHHLTGIDRDLSEWLPVVTRELELTPPHGWPIQSCVHGDLFLNNSLAHPDGDPVLVDLESSGYGSPLSDLGHVVADLAIRTALGAIDRTDAIQAWAAFCTGYGRTLDPVATRWRNPYLRTIPWLATRGALSAHLAARQRDWLGIEGDLVAHATTLAQRSPVDPPW